MNMGVQASQPIEIFTSQDLHDVRKCLTCDYVLMNDIDLTYDTQDPAGKFFHQGRGWDPIGTFGSPFEGSFDGNGHAIIGLTIDRDQNYVGLFGRIAKTTNRNKQVRDLIMKDVDIRGIDYVGAIAGNIEYASVSLLAISGSIVGRMYVGGVTGYGYYATIDKVYCKALITGQSIGIGGIIGRLGRSSMISDVHVEGKIQAKACQDASSINCAAGGIVGRDEASAMGVFRSFFNGGLLHNVPIEIWQDPNKYAKPIIGLSYGSPISQNYHTDNTPSFSADHIETAFLMDEQMFIGFDFSMIWVMDFRPVLQNIHRFEVNQSDIEYLYFERYPSKRLYFVDEPLQLDDMEVRVIYQDGSSHEILDIEVIGSTETIGQIEIMIRHHDHSVSFMIEVKNKPNHQVSLISKGIGGSVSLWCDNFEITSLTVIDGCELSISVELFDMGRLDYLIVNGQKYNQTTYIVDKDVHIQVRFYTLGDFDDNGMINQSDLELMLDGLHRSLKNNQKQWDVNEDGTFDIADFVFLRRYMLFGGTR